MLSRVLYSSLRKKYHQKYISTFALCSDCNQPLVCSSNQTCKLKENSDDFVDDVILFTYMKPLFDEPSASLKKTNQINNDSDSDSDSDED
jgi:hypothetical protein